MALVFTKTDKTKANDLRKNMGLFEAKISESGRVAPAVFTSSAEKRTGRTELLEFIGKTLGSD